MVESIEFFGDKSRSVLPGGDGGSANAAAANQVGQVLVDTASFVAGIK